MNIKAIIASLVLGSSSVAMASPAVIVRDHRVEDPCTAPIAQPVAVQPVYQQPVYQPVYQEPVYQQPVYQQPVGYQPAPIAPVRQLPPQFAPVTLANGIRFANDGRAFISVGSQAGRFDKLDIHAAGGPAFVQQVYIQFANGQEQVIRNLNRTLTSNDCLTLDLDGSHRAISRIVVYGNGLNRGWRRAAGAITVTAA